MTTRGGDSGSSDQPPPPKRRTMETQTADEYLVDTQIWFPPEPENNADDNERVITHDGNEDEEYGDGIKWEKASNLSSLEQEAEKAKTNVMKGKLKALVEGLVKSSCTENDGDNWVDIVTRLSWEAAFYLITDAFVGKEIMDPDGYVKVKCSSSDTRQDSQVFKGLVFKKHAAKKDMPARFEKPKLLLIKGVLGSSSEEKNKGAYVVEMIEKLDPSVIMVEKTVSRDIQDYIHEKRVTLVLEMEQHRLDIIARFTGSPILSSDNLNVQELKKCESFKLLDIVEEHVDEVFKIERKTNETLMYLETRMPVTILLKGSHINELKRIKCVVEFAVIMAYHLIREIPFFMDQQVALFSTAAPNGMINIFPNNNDTNVPITNKSTPETDPVSTVDIPVSDGSNENVSDNLSLQGSTNLSSIEYEPWDPSVLSAVLKSESILILRFRRNVTKGTICEQSFSLINFYSCFDVPLGKFLQDNLLNQEQNLVPCGSCKELPEAHFDYYRHHNKELRIQVKRLPLEKQLPSHNEGELWMWGCCGQCEPGKLKFTKRVLLSVAHCSLSFGKFLELGFSNQSLWQVPLSNCGGCGHSSDYLHFFGLGSMVAMFKYSTVATAAYSVSLPLWKIKHCDPVQRKFLNEEVDDDVCSLISCALDSVESDTSSLGQPDRVLSLVISDKKYSVGFLFSKAFLDLRGQCDLSELDYISSLSACKNWNAKGGKSKAFFAKTLDGRFIIKEIKDTEFQSFINFGPTYFEYMNQCFNLGNQTCLAKILGIYQVHNEKRGVTRDLMVMENVTYGRKVTKQYDLKGKLYGRFNDVVVDDPGDVVLDQNFVNDMNAFPLYVSLKAKHNLQRAVWNDTAFLKSIYVMDYSLLVGVDSEQKEFVCGIIDYLGQYTWSKKVENKYKSFVAPKGQSPTIIPPSEYRKRFRNFIDINFLIVPNDWCSQRPSNRCSLCCVTSDSKSHEN